MLHVGISFNRTHKLIIKLYIDWNTNLYTIINFTENRFNYLILDVEKLSSRLMDKINEVKNQENNTVFIGDVPNKTLENSIEYQCLYLEEFLGKLI